MSEEKEVKDSSSPELGDSDVSTDENSMSDDESEEENHRLRAALITIIGYVPLPTLFYYLWNSRIGRNEYSSSEALLALYSDLLTFNLLVLPIILTHINHLPEDTERTAASITMLWVAYLRYALMPIGFSMVNRHSSEIKELFEDALGIVGLILEELEVPNDYYDKVSYGTDLYEMNLSAFSSTVDSSSK
ncbi:MAG TPA: hypothetical protein PKJ26_03080 [Candidatus Woesebacteria bacterium]|nr:hypothetical protein [Candidatus Woesebacteria bacterium]HNS65453.1 hypothetical protein [Candidatus Woesebacteria bacterium]